MDTITFTAKANRLALLDHQLNEAKAKVKALEDALKTEHAEAYNLLDSVKKDRAALESEVRDLVMQTHEAGKPIPTDFFGLQFRRKVETKTDERDIIVWLAQNAPYMLPELVVLDSKAMDKFINDNAVETVDGKSSFPPILKAFEGFFDVVKVPTAQINWSKLPDVDSITDSITIEPEPEVKSATVADLPETPEAAPAVGAWQKIEKGISGSNINYSVLPEHVFVWAKEVASDPDTVYLDTETTSKYPETAEVVEIAIVGHDGKVLMNQRVKPIGPMPEDAKQIHGISDDDLKDCPSFKDIAEDVKTHLEGKRVVIYNRGYDVPVLVSNFERHGLTLKESDIDAQCAMLAYSVVAGERSRYGNYKWKSLVSAASARNIEFNGNAHGALADADVTRRLVESLAK